MENLIYSDILSWAAPDVDEPEVNTDVEKIRFILSKYQEFAKYQRFNPKWNEADKIADWLGGGGGSFRCPIYNDDIFLCAYRWGLLKESDSEELHDNFLENWFSFIGQQVINTRKEIEKYEPVSAGANDILQASTVSGLVVRLPDGQLDRALYLEVKAKLELIGGKWNTKEKGFLFKTDPEELLARVAGGERVNLQKQYQYFPTPKKVADKLVKLAGVREGETILEPSAGQGAIIDSIRAAAPENMVFYVEKMPTNSHILKQKYQDQENIFSMFADDDDFLNLAGESFDKIVANPPFSGNQDIQHIMKMWDLLKPGGRLVSLASRHFQFAEGRVEKEFREFLGANRATTTDVPAGAFKESGTNIATCIIVLNKPGVSDLVAAPAVQTDVIPFEAIYKPIKRPVVAQQLSLFGS